MHGNPSGYIYMATKTKDVETSEVKVYELGAHIVSSLPEEAVGNEFALLKDMITKSEGSIVSEEAPKLMDLAYTMVKHTHGKNVRHTTAHFTWIKFEIDPASIPTIHDAVSKNENVLRFIIVRTVKENTLQGNKYANEGKEGGKDSRDGKRESRKEKPAAEPVAEAEVDKAIGNIVAE